VAGTATKERSFRGGSIVCRKRITEIQPEQREHEMRSILLWLLGVPIPIIILIALLR
jgi:hypothetical protein